MRRRRIARGVAANILDKLAVALVQLLAVPVLATSWGLDVYGSWVLLSTLPSFLAASDFGFATAAGTQMTMLVAGDRRAEAVRVFQSAWAVILTSSAAMITLALIAAWSVPSSILPQSPGLVPAEARLALSLLLIYGIVSLQGTIFNAGFRCAGRYATGATWTAITVLIENGAAIGIVLAGGRPVAAAAALLAGRGGSLIVQAGLLRLQVPWLRLGFSEARRVEARALISPALAVVALPLGQALFLQGTALALGIARSPAAVPAFTATRTLSRIGLQMTQLLNHAFMPEYSAAVARNDRTAQARMLAATLAAAGVVITPFAIMLALFGPALVARWTGGVIHPDRALMVVMALTVMLGGFWTPLSNLILAMNRHASYAYPYLALAAATVPMTYVLAHRLGATGAAVSITLLDAAMCIVITRLGRRLFVGHAELAAVVGGFVDSLRRGVSRS